MGYLWPDPEVVAMVGVAVLKFDWWDDYLAHLNYILIRTGGQVLPAALTYTFNITLISPQVLTRMSWNMGADELLTANNEYLDVW